MPARTIFFLLLVVSNAGAQLKVNIGVDSSTSKARLAMKFLDRYFEDFRADNEVNYRDYFDEKDLSNLYYPDKVAFGLIADYNSYYLGDAHLLALDVKTDTVKAMIMFAETDSLKKLTVNFIANYYIKMKGDTCRFLVNQQVEEKNWQKKTIRNITFHFPSYHLFSEKKASELIQSIVALEQDWGLKPINIHYHFAQKRKEIQALKGFDFNYYMARSEYPGGMAYEKEKSIYCWGYGENYFHEVVHLYLNPVFPDSPLLEGIATFYGGSIGKSYKTDLMKLSQYLENHPATNLSDPSQFYYLDEETNPQYAIQALICYLVFEKKGVKGLRELLAIPGMEEVYRKEFGVEPAGQNQFLREQIAVFAKGAKAEKK